MEIVFSKLPNSLDELKSMPEFSFESPFKTAAMFILCIRVYPENRDESYNMIDGLKGPEKLSPMDKQFIRDRMMDKGDYLANAYFKGATPENNYELKEPYTILVEENPYSYEQEGYCKLFIKTNGADSPRPVQLRKKGNEWFLWSFNSVLSGIRKPDNQDPWK